MIVKPTTVKLIATLILGVLGAPVATEAQPSKNTARLGFLGSSTVERDKGRVEAFPLVINLKTAKALGLTIPQSMRLPADQLMDGCPTCVRSAISLC